MPFADVVAHMAASLGETAALAAVRAAASKVGAPVTGVLTADQAEALLVTLSQETGLVGLAARVTKQKIRLNMSIAPAAKPL